MFSAIFNFEVRRLIKSTSTYMYFLILFLVSFFMALIIGGAFKDINANLAGEKIMANSPIVIDAFYSFITGWIGAIIIVAIVGNAVLKDFKYNTHNLIFTSQVNRGQYLGGRFAAAMLMVIVLFSAPAFGMMLAYKLPFVNPDKVGAFMLAPYLQTYLCTVLPNALLQGAIFFAVSLLARDIFIIWLSLIIFWVCLGLSNAFFSSLQYEQLSAMIDPLGGHAKRAISKYWSTYDKNHLVYQLKGLFLWNRLLWLGLSVLIFLIGYFNFSFTSAPRRLSFFKPKGIDVVKGKATVLPAFNAAAIPTVSRSFNTSTRLGILWGLSVNECKTLLRNVYFRIIFLFGILFLLLSATQLIKGIYETPTLPVTYLMVEGLGGSLQLFIVILTIFFGGEIVWRARENRMDNILDALPVPNWVFYTSKLAGLLFMQLLLVGIIMLCGIIVQATRGYTNFEILLYIKYLTLFRLPDLWILAILCFFVQSLVNNKFIGYFIVAIFYIFNSFFASMVLKHALLIFSSDPGVMYSDMNGFGHSAFPYFMFKLYWGSFAFCLAVISSLLWPRGSESGLKTRMAMVDPLVRRKSMTALTIGMLAFLGCGSFIYYNTDVLNKNLSSFKREEEQAKYEKAYKKYEHSPQPKITDVMLNVDIYPMERSLHSNGTYVIKNKTAYSIDSLHLIIPSDSKINSLHLSRSATLVLNDTTVAYKIYKLAQPMAPGDTLTIAFSIDMNTHGFTQDFSGTGSPLYNGTFVNNESFLPSIGYNKFNELTDNNQRKKHGLDYRATANKITDTASYNNNFFLFDADYISFDATVSTVPDQIAIAPGYLQKEWTDKGRRYFHYKMDSPIMNFYSFLSARYEVKKEVYNGVNLEIYYHKGHEHNLGRMMLSMRKSLEYYSANFSPYQHKQVRIIEFPRYSTFAQSFPNTIPFSEGIGFIADVNDSSKNDIDYVFYVTAHEVGHQWWAHQVAGADVEGSNMLSESLAQYSSITVMEHQYGEEKIKKFLKQEMDKYLTARSNESEKEKPLGLVDLGQGYILYQKGGLIMHSLGKYLGEDSVNHALHNFLARYAFKAPPYPTTRNFVACIRAVTPDSMQYMITDDFERIIVYDNKVTDLQAEKTSDGYTAKLSLDIRKLQVDSTGRETPTACNDYIDIAIYKDRSTVLQTIRYKLKDGPTTLTIPLSSKPYKVVIDPALLLIDKKPEDNEFRLGDEKIVVR